MKDASLKKRIGKALCRRAKKQAAFITDKKYQEEPEYAEAIPSSRWHNLEKEWNGARYRFQMNINDHPMFGGETRLGHVYSVDAENDEWVEAPDAVLEKARQDKALMTELMSDVEKFESGRHVEDDSERGDEEPKEEPAEESEEV